MRDIDRVVADAARSLEGLRAVSAALTACELALRKLSLDAVSTHQLARLAVLPGIDPEVLRAVAAAASDQDQVTMTRLEQLKAYLLNADSLGLLREPDEAELIATGSDNWDSITLPGVKDTWSALKYMIDYARRDFSLAAPYMTHAGLTHILDYAKAASGRGVAITLVTTKGTQRPPPPVPDYVNLVAYDEEARWFHCKLGSCDGGVWAYIGSANTTNRALDEGLEVGVMLTGPIARRVASILASLARG